MVAGHEPERLERGTDGTGVVVDLPPAHVHRAVGGRHRRSDEADAGAGVGCEFEPLDGRQAVGVGHPSDASRPTDVHDVSDTSCTSAVCQARGDGAATSRRRRRVDRRSTHPARPDPRWPRHRVDRSRRRPGCGDHRLQRSPHLAGLHRSAVQRCRGCRPHDRSDVDRNGCAGTPPVRRHVVPADGGHEPGDGAPGGNRSDAQRAQTRSDRRRRSDRPALRGSDDLATAPRRARPLARRPTRDR